MKSITVMDNKGKTTGKFFLDQSYFNGKINKPFLYQTALIYLAKQRANCASTKTRKQVRGGGRKPWRQKGTGRARVGTIRSPLWRGGGVVFGPHPKKNGYRLAQGIRSRALQQGLNGKIKDNELIVVDNISLSKPKTKEFTLFLAALKVKEKSLLVIEKYIPDIMRAARNIPNISVKVFNDVNLLDLLQHKKVIFSKQALENLVKLRQ